LDRAAAARYLRSMSFARLIRWVELVSAGVMVVGCGQATWEPDQGATSGDSALPTLAERFAFAKSGQRLQALGYVSEGVTQFRTLHDQLLDVDCEFVSGKQDRALRCVPRQSAQLIFLDARCSEPATWVEEWGFQAGDWVSIGPPSTACPGQALPHRETFQVGDEVYAEVRYGSGLPLYELQGGQCVATTPPGKSIPAVNRLIPYAESGLVAAKRVTFDAGGGLRVSRLLGEDGSELTVAVSTAAGEDCSLQADGLCTPTFSALEQWEPYSTMLDAGCETPALIAHFPSGCGTPRFGVVRRGEDQVRVHRLQPATQLFARSQQVSEPDSESSPISCEPAHSSHYTSSFALGSEVTATFPRAQRIRQGSGAIHIELFVPQVAVSASPTPIARYPEADFLDATGAPCQVVPADDGSLRCASLAAGAYESGNWADAACTERLYVGYPPGAEPSSLRVALRSTSDALTAVSTVKIYEGPVYTFNRGECVASAAQDGLLALDRRIEISALPEVFETTL
jgi:hypothetical protein